MMSKLSHQNIDYLQKQAKNYIAKRSMTTILSEIRNISASLWISASAGTGKTKNLIDRILALLLNGVIPSKILCLTYTNAASAEMLTRLSQYLKKLRSMSDYELKNELILLGFEESFMGIAKSLYDKSMNPADWVQIKTIHSFCFSLLKKFPLETGLFPGVKLCDDYQKKSLLGEAIQLALAKSSLQKHLLIIAKYTNDIAKLIEQHYAKISNFLSQFHDFETLYSTYFNTEKNALYIPYEELDNYLFNMIFLGKHRELFSELSEILYKGTPDDIKKADILNANYKNPSSDFLEAFLTDKHTIRSRLYTKKLSSTHPQFATKMDETAQLAMEFYERKTNNLSARANIAIFSVLKEIVCNFNELKRQNHFIDFHDIISITLLLLNNVEWVMYKIDGGLEHILIDEAQDTSQEQWEIIKTITDEFFSNYNSKKTVFVVGDEKQSIYSFQGADVRLFHKMHRYFKLRSEENGQKFHDVVLNKSYRSTGKILEFVDNIFCKSFPNIKHITNRSTNSGVVEIIDLFEDDETDEPKAWEIQQELKNHQTADKKLVKHIAEFIKNTINSGIFVESKNRPAKPSDFLILFQHRNTISMQNIINVLKEANIPVTDIDKILLKDELIVQDLIVFAEFAIFPLDDLACARLLKSPIIGVTEDELMQLCIDRKAEHLWNYILKDDAFCKKYSIAHVKNIIENACSTSACDFFMKAVNCELKEKFIGRLGIKCLDILFEFLDLVMSYSQENNASLPSFIEWFRSFEHEIKRESFSNENAVRLMTVHASKGLQAPFVILADTHFFPKTTERILEAENGILIWNFSADDRSKKTSDLSMNYASFDNEESKRLLYVAATRAEDSLRIIGEQKKNDKNCWHKFICTNIDVQKFEKTFINDHEVLRYGNYNKASVENNSANAVETESPIMALPSWFFEKIDTPEPQLDTLKTDQMIYGDCVHILLNKIPQYKKYFLQKSNDIICNDFSFDTFADSALVGIDISEIKKKAIKTEVHAILTNKKFDFIFNNKALSEVSFIMEGKERRIDKIAFQNNTIWIIDFKTGTPQKIIPSAYVRQLSDYKNAVLKIRNSQNAPGNIGDKKYDKIKTAILWTQSAELAEIPENHNDILNTGLE